MFLKLPNGLIVNTDWIKTIDPSVGGTDVHFADEEGTHFFVGEDGEFIKRVFITLAERNYYQHFGRTHPVEEA